ncbi:unannotated protein [freshwater metagenome]|uniref:Unannotated protein n=1 Tax=freshwater metagenome TaxID=449393 RepID=A0A6J7F041_9ZZZZ
MAVDVTRMRSIARLRTNSHDVVTRRSTIRAASDVTRLVIEMTPNEPAICPNT